jgi:hypothetical protein
MAAYTSREESRSRLSNGAGPDRSKNSKNMANTHSTVILTQIPCHRICELQRLTSQFISQSKQAAQGIIIAKGVQP